jgi:short-subunit dehydrogenase
MNRKIVIIGATSTIAEHCARLWVAQPNTEIHLIGRNQPSLTLIAQDLKIRGPQNKIEIGTADFNDPDSITQTVDRLCNNQVPDIVLIAHGTLPDQQNCQDDLVSAKEAMEINGLSPVLFAEGFANHMDKTNTGRLAIIGSVAGDRGRQSNYVYGAAKGLVTRYAQGLQHRFHRRGIKVSLIKPGPTDTKMTHALKVTGAKLADAKQVAAEIVKGIDQGKTVIYTPIKWMIIMLIIRSLPNFIFGKMRI